MKKILYVKYSNDRGRSFSIRTSIVEQNGIRSVEKSNMFPEGSGHIRRQNLYYEKYAKQYSSEGVELIPCAVCENGVVYDYVEGATLAERISQLLEDRKLDSAKECVEGFCRRIMKLYGREPWKKTREFCRVFGDVPLAEGMSGCSFVNIDFVAENIIPFGETYYLMDYEWTFDFPVPALYVVYRAAAALQLSCNSFRELREGGLYERLGLTTEYCHIFQTMERNFQSYVQQGRIPAHLLYQDIGKPVRNVQNILQREKNSNMPVVYFDMGDGFCEENKCEIPFWKEQEGIWYYNWEVPSGVLRMRLDPCSRGCMITQLTVNGEKAVLEALETNGELRREGIVFLSEDPNIFLPVKDSDVRRYEIAVGMETGGAYMASLHQSLQESREQARNMLTEQIRLQARLKELSDTLDEYRIMRQRSAYTDDIVGRLYEKRHKAWRFRRNLDEIRSVYNEDGTMQLTLRGWLFADKAAIDEARINVGLEEYPVDYGMPRQDVSGHYPKTDRALNCGFSFQGVVKSAGRYAVLRFFSGKRVVIWLDIDLKEECILE